MDNWRSKTCTHCGGATYRQPQDSNHDTGYGHCLDCLSEFYRLEIIQIAPAVKVNLFREQQGHNTVVEIYKDGALTCHETISEGRIDGVIGYLKAKYVGSPAGQNINQS